MTDNPHELTIENSALVLIDHQPWVAFAVESIDRSLLINNVTGLAHSAKALEVGPPRVTPAVIDLQRATDGREESANEDHGGR